MEYGKPSLVPRRIFRTISETFLSVLLSQSEIQLFTYAYCIGFIAFFTASLTSKVLYYYYCYYVSFCVVALYYSQYHFKYLLLFFFFVCGGGGVVHF